VTSGESFVSPYLLRPLRSLEQALRERDRLRNPGTTAVPGAATAQHQGSDKSDASTEPRREA
jgi:hypothetical protein